MTRAATIKPVRRLHRALRPHTARLLTCARRHCRDAPCHHHCHPRPWSTVHGCLCRQRRDRRRQPSSSRPRGVVVSAARMLATAKVVRSAGTCAPAHTEGSSQLKGSASIGRPRHKCYGDTRISDMPTQPPQPVAQASSAGQSPLVSGPFGCLSTRHDVQRELAESSSQAVSPSMLAVKSTAFRVLV